MSVRIVLQSQDFTRINVLNCTTQCNTLAIYIFYGLHIILPFLVVIDKFHIRKACLLDTVVSLTGKIEFFCFERNDNFEATDKGNLVIFSALTPL